ncbi:MAG TPA: MOSC N-terminal beta barrel domain-containing protein [Candidatus Binataceae bacterium]|nr:MOSC N-terminal beta barrel domain-containing protein [Candidatus Binataceae bacterium]
MELEANSAITPIIGAVAGLWRYPVKSMMGEELETAQLTERGVLGDRAYAVIDQATGKVASAKNPRRWPQLFGFSAAYAAPPRAGDALPPVVIGLPGGEAIRSDSPLINRRLAALLDREVTLACDVPAQPHLEEYWPDLATLLAHRDEVTDEAMPPGTFFDCAPIHVLTTATLARLSELYPEGRFEPRRFRPNLLIASNAGSAAFPENDWVGRTLAIGAEVQLKISGNTGRCVMTTLAQGGLPRDLAILRTAATHNQANVGVYATVTRAGLIRPGDSITLV